MIKLKQQTNNRVTIILMIVIIVLISILSPLQTFCADNTIIEIADDLNQTIVEELDNIDFSELNDIVLEFQQNDTNLFSLDNVKNKVFSIISGKNAIEYTSFFSSLFSTIIKKIIRYLPILSLIVAVGVISNLLGNIKSKFNEKSTGDLVHLVCFLSVVVVVIGMVSSLNATTGKTISNMVNTMNVLFPILLTLMIGTGATASAGVFQPIVAIFSTYIADFFKFLVMPLFLFSFVFGIISNLSDSIKLDKFNSFISSLFKWSVGLVFTLFFAMFAIQGISAGKFDSISIRTTKYTIKSYIPIMGGYLSDGMDLILASSVLIKNSIGLVGILMILNIILSPLLEIAIFSIFMKLISAILQPMGNNKLSNFLSSTSKTITMLSTCIIAIGFMFLVSVGLVMTSSNVVL